MKRKRIRIVLVGSTCLLSWLGMMIVHEAGHVLHAWLSGGRVEKVVLHPLTISRTDVDPNPHPLFVVWGGPIWGCLLPLAAAFALKKWGRPGLHFALFFAGFCLIANGVYLGSGYWFPVGDAEQLIELGTPAWLLLCFGAAAVSGGLSMWHQLGRRFGLNSDGELPGAKAATAVTFIVVLIALIEIALSDRR